MIESQLTDGAVALNLFEQVRSRPLRPPTEDMRGPEYADRRRELEDRFLSKEGSRDPWEASWGEHEEAPYRAEVELQREQWRNGVWPYNYESRLLFLYARSFLLSMDMIKKMMVVLAKDTPGVPSNVKTHVQNFKTHFPSLKDVRDTEQHLEDRGRGLRKDKKTAGLEANKQFSFRCARRWSASVGQSKWE